MVNLRGRSRRLWVRGVDLEPGVLRLRKCALFCPQLEMASHARQNSATEVRASVQEFYELEKFHHRARDLGGSRFWGFLVILIPLEKWSAIEVLDSM